MELRAFPYDAFNPNLATMSFDDVLGDGQAEAGAANFTRASGIDAIESLENARLIILRDADSRVRHCKDYKLTTGCCADFDTPARSRVLDGIVEQISQDLAKQAGVSAHARQISLRMRSTQGKLFLTGSQPHGFDARFNQVARIDGLEINFYLPGFDARELEKVISQTSEARGVRTDNLDEVAIVFLIIERSREQRFGKTLNSRQRRPQFVGNIGDEILADLLEAA